LSHRLTNSPKAFSINTTLKKIQPPKVEIKLDTYSNGLQNRKNDDQVKFEKSKKEADKIIE